MTNTAIMKDFKRLFYGLAISSMFSLSLAHAEEEAAISWDALNEYEQKVLIGLKSEWQTIPPERQLQLQKGAAHWLDRTIRRRGFDRERYKRWQQFSAEEKARLRQRFQKFQHLSPEERDRIRDARRRFEQLSPEERKDWRERWESLPPEVRARIEERRERRQQRESRNDSRHDDAAGLTTKAREE